MPTIKNINNLVINQVENQEVYEYMQANGLVNDDELYLVEGESTAVLFVEQILSDSQKTQARVNIDALGTPDIVSDEEFFMWLVDADIVMPVTSASGEIYVSNSNELYIL